MYRATVPDKLRVSPTPARRGAAGSEDAERERAAKGGIADTFRPYVPVDLNYFLLKRFSAFYFGIFSWFVL